MNDKNIKIDLVDDAEDTAESGQELPEKESVSTFRLVATLAVAGALAGLLIVMVNLHTKPIIDKYKAEQLALAVYEVIPGTDYYRTFYLVDSSLSLELPEGAQEAEYKRV